MNAGWLVREESKLVDIWMKSPPLKTERTMDLEEVDVWDPREVAIVECVVCGSTYHDQ